MVRSAHSAPGGAAEQALEEYRLGLRFFEKKQWKSAARHFGIAERKSHRNDVHEHVYRSFHGLALINCGDVSGLNLCRHAAGMETIQASVFYNLALAELHFQHRKRACNAVMVGLNIDPRDEDLKRLRRKMGIRRRPAIPFLTRENIINKWLGRATYRKTLPRGARR